MAEPSSFFSDLESAAMENLCWIMNEHDGDGESKLFSIFNYYSWGSEKGKKVNES